MFMPYTTYQVLSPRSRQTRVGTCEEADCPQQATGWVTAVDESTALGQWQAHYIRGDRSRRQTESRTREGWTAFAFPPGQTCFAEHRVSLERPPLFVVRAGHRRGSPADVEARRRKPEDWVDDFANNQSSIADEQQRG